MASQGGGPSQGAPSQRYGDGANEQMFQQGASSSFGQRASRVIPAVNSLYSAFGDYESATRQRKYMITELEDTIEALQNGLEEREQRNAAKRLEVEKLQLIADATVVSYERACKEKTLIENEYQNLAKEMDKVLETKARKLEQLDQLEVTRQEQVDRMKKLTDQHLAGYMENPKIAEMMKITNNTEIIQRKIRELAVVKENLENTKSNLVAQHKEGWDAFVKKCVEVAETRRELLKKMELNKNFKAQFDQALKRPPLRNSLLSQRSQLSQMAPVAQKIQKRPNLDSAKNSKELGSLGRTTVRYKRSSAFEVMDRMLKKSNSTSTIVSVNNMGPPLSSLPISAKMNSAFTQQNVPAQRTAVIITPMPRISDKSQKLSESRGTEKNAPVVEKHFAIEETVNEVPIAQLEIRVDKEINQPSLHVAESEPSAESLSQNMFKDVIEKNTTEVSAPFLDSQPEKSTEAPGVIRNPQDLLEGAAAGNSYKGNEPSLPFSFSSPSPSSANESLGFARFDYFGSSSTKDASPGSSSKQDSSFFSFF